jgi:hypothetical protein
MFILKRIGWFVGFFILCFGMATSLCAWVFDWASEVFCLLGVVGMAVSIYWMFTIYPPKPPPSKRRRLEMATTLLLDSLFGYHQALFIFHAAIDVTKGDRTQQLLAANAKATSDLYEHVQRMLHDEARIKFGPLDVEQ